ncbi:TrkH family potassium uptake protein [Haloarcula sp. S1AR25-5A]|uniref:TrkH family potassium uptake protein n=1 Tax=Haloarcula terrestris TaxID=2950533 RepID=A0AAE4EZ13_9EURY|nr:TrkH family potassium uptake protein [Haloarcula terrestris]MDS0222895.1 TrkH family potassium uptake protein [Haloarcula terrestris]
MALTTVDVRSSLNVLGAILQWLAVPLVIPVVVALLYAESVLPYLVTIAVALGVGTALTRLPRDRIEDREAFLTVSLAWLSIAVVGAIPLYIEGTGVFASPVNALFEGMSGITTTGATVIRDFDAHSQALLMWRQVLQWLGGLGVLLLATAVLSRLSVAGAQLMETESRTEDVTKLTPGIEDTARIIGSLYLALTVAAALILFALGLSGLAPEMTLFDAIAHAFTAIATAGFSPQAESIGAFSPAVQWAVTLFMIVGATNFVLLYALVRGETDRFRDSEEFHFYLGILGVGSLLIGGLLVLDQGYTAGVGDTVRHAVFQTAAIVTTTGFASTDFNTWSAGAKNVLFVMMFIGGMAGSTTCSIKTLRWLVVTKSFWRDLNVSAHRRSVRPVRLGRDVVSEDTVRDVYAYTLVALVFFIIGTVLLVVDGERAGAPITEFEALSAAASMFFNIGPAFGQAGPYGTYDGFVRSSKVLMILLMWIGRIEIVPVLVMLTPTFWTR